MANNIAYADIFQSTLDEQLLQEMTSSWMEANSSRVIYDGGNTVKVAKITLDEMGAYNRATGYDDGDVDLTFQSHTFTQDRSKKMIIDAMDVNEANFVPTATLIMSEFQRTKVAPQIDSYRYSKIFGLANAGLKTSNYKPATSTIFAELSKDIARVQDIIGETTPLVVCMNFHTANILDNADKIEKKLDVADFDMGGVSTKVRMLDTTPIVRVSSSRFKTDYTFAADGYSVVSTALNMNWIIIARTTPLGIVKTDKPKIIDPDMNQSADAWIIALRKYHDLWILDNKLDSVWVSYESTVAPELTTTVAAGTGAGNTKFTATAAEGNTLAYSLTAEPVDGFQNVIYDYDDDDYTSEANIEATAGQYLNMFEITESGRVVKFATVELEEGDIDS